MRRAKRDKTTTTTKETNKNTKKNTNQKRATNLLELRQ